MISNDELVGHVADELLWDPKVDSAAVAVSAQDGTVTLRGTVGSFREKREAQKAAERVWGVIGVENELEVKLMSDSKRDDADLRGDVLKAMMLDALVPDIIDALPTVFRHPSRGSADWQYQRDEADFVASNIRGVTGLVNEIELTGPPPTSGDVKDGIKDAFKRNAKLDANDLSVETSGRTVTVKGTVSSWAEHDQAIDAAWAAPGVQKVAMTTWFCTSLLSAAMRTRRRDRPRAAARALTGPASAGATRFHAADQRRRRCRHGSWARRCRSC